MQQESFEEELNRKMSGFSMTPRESLWEEIEEHLIPEKRKKSAVWLWLPVGLIMTGGIAFFSIQGIGEKVKVVSTDRVVDKTLLSNVNGNDNTAPFNNKTVAENTLPSSERTVLKKQSQLAIRHKESKKNNAFQTISSGNLMEPSAIDEKLVPPEQDIVSDNRIESGIEKSTNVSTDAEVLKGNAENMGIKEQPIDTSKKAIAILPLPIKTGKFYVGLMLTPVLSNTILSMGQSTLQPGNASGNPQADYNSRKGTDKSSLMLGIGIHGGYINGRHHFYTAIQYQAMGYQLLVRNIEIKRPLTGSSLNNGFKVVATDSFAFKDKQDGGSYRTNKFHYLSIPVGYSFSFINTSRFGVGLAGCLSYNIMLQSNALLYDESSGYYIRQNSSNQVNLRKSNLILGAGLELNYKWNAKVMFTLLPQYGFTMHPVEKTAINTGLKYVGIGMGVKWFLK